MPCLQQKVMIILTDFTGLQEPGAFFILCGRLQNILAIAFVISCENMFVDCGVVVFGVFFLSKYVSLQKILSLL